MSSKKIYILRHGQTDFNLQGIVQGSGVDSSLNAMGRAQARAFFEMYRSVPFDKIFTSTLKRTKETIADFIALGIPHESYSGLNEISWGVNEGQKITPDEDAYYHWMLQQWESGNTGLRIQGGESPDEVALRQQPVMEKLYKETGQHILICMHGRAIRILLCQLLRYPLKSMDMFEHGNVCLYVLEFDGIAFSVTKYNDTNHLINLKAPKTEVEERTIL
ncbi:MAG: histidine phosphatase family protein [Bacteroidetes bacterium]|nr:histidine phosphatase family protein [Bacteroidota bacterium]MBI3483345.1 histidine phosphatase family protein [Bacteroidota bacterium]